MFSKIIQNIPILLIALFSVLLSQNLKAGQSGSMLKTRVSDDTVLVKFIPGVKGEAKRNAHAQANGAVKKRIRSLDVEVIKVPKGFVNAAIETYLKNPNVIYAEADLSRSLFVPATDEGSESFFGITNNFNEQYALNNVGQGFGGGVDWLLNPIHPLYQAISGADINAPEGWAAAGLGTEPVYKGQPDSFVAVLDSGVDCNHLDLVNKCVESVNFVAHHGSGPDDLVGHGTHVAGIIAAQTNNSVGIAGVAPNAGIGAMKVCWEEYDWFGSIANVWCDDSDIAAAIDYVAKADPLNQPLYDYKVINMSLAGMGATDTLAAAVKQAWDMGLVIVAAAGNSYSQVKQYPAAYTEAIAVGATDYYDNLAGYSSFGNWVSVLAPGTAIFSTMPGSACGQTIGDCYNWLSGTSMAAPHVAGLVALLAADPAGYSNTEIRNIIEGSAVESGALGQNFTAWATHGRIDMAAAVNYSPDVDPPVEPPAPENYSVPSIVTGTVNGLRAAKHAQATVTILYGGNPAVGVSVEGNFSFDSGAESEYVPNSSELVIDTDANGVAVLTTLYSEKGISFTFCVTSIDGETIWDGQPSCAAFP